MMANSSPKVCCGVPSVGFPSVSFYGIPREWFLETRGHVGGNCAGLKTVETIQGGTFKCLTNGLYTGAGYGFRSRRRDTGDLDCAEEAMTECVGHQRADTFEVGDRRKFSLVDLTDA
jgi:hypothetical protein